MSQHWMKYIACMKLNLCNKKNRDDFTILIVPNANHVDLYDDVNKIPFNKIEDFFNSTFAKE